LSYGHHFALAYYSTFAPARNSARGARGAPSARGGCLRPPASLFRTGLKSRCWASKTPSTTCLRRCAQPDGPRKSEDCRSPQSTSITKPRRRPSARLCALWLRTP